MSVMLWGILAIAVGLAGFAVAAWIRRPKLPPLEHGTQLPATPLQRLAAWGLLAGLLPAVAAGAMVVWYGPQTIYDRDPLRLVFTLLLLLVVVVFLVGIVRLKAWVARADATLDERDRTILGRAPAFQSTAMLLTLAAWLVPLVEHFHSAGAVPLFYLYLIFWSCWAVSLLALPLGILVGYWWRR
jgi:high-affinity Fe2+/Pb2+ permease